MTKIVQVVSALLIKPNQQLLISQRPSDKPMPYFWEFPGGKVESDEMAINALSRELLEELGITLDPLFCHPFVSYEYHYPAFVMQMTSFKCYKWKGKIQLKENQGGFHWINTDEITKFSMPPGSFPIVEALLDQPDALKADYTLHTDNVQYYPSVES